MPTYDYVCEACGHEFEHFQSMSDRYLRTCPKCAKKKLVRKVGAGAGLIFKGTGFYITDYKKAGSSPAGDAAASKSGSEGKSTAEGSSGSAGKPGSEGGSGTDRKSGSDGRSGSGGGSSDRKPSDAKAPDARTSDAKSSPPKPSQGDGGPASKPSRPGRTSGGDKSS